MAIVSLINLKKTRSTFNHSKLRAIPLAGVPALMTREVESQLVELLPCEQIILSPDIATIVAKYLGIF